MVRATLVWQSKTSYNADVESLGGGGSASSPLCQAVFMSTPNYYAIIPANVRYSDIPAAAKLLYGELTALTSKEGYCWAPNKYFAELYGVEVRVVQYWVRALEKKGFIRSELGPAGNTRKIWLTTDKFGNPMQDFAPPHAKIMLPSISITKSIPASPVLVVKDTPTKKEPKKTEVYIKLVKWAENERGFPFLSGSITKQYAAFKEAKNNGLKPYQLQERWQEMANEAFWEAKGFDWMDVVKSFNKKPA